MKKKSQPSLLPSPKTETRTDDQIDDAIELWHGGHGMGGEIYEYLGWTWEQYKHWVETSEKP